MTLKILVLPERPDTATALLRAAQRLAELTGAAGITVLVICRPVAIPILATSDGKFSQSEMDRFMTAERQRLAALAACYDQWSAQLPANALVAEHRLVNGDTAAVVAEHATAAEFIVVGHPGAQDETTSRETFRAAIFATNRPVLVVPSGPPASFGRCVGVSWREDRHARQAIATAMPLLRAAERIHVFAGVRERRPQVVLPDCFDEVERRSSLHVLSIGGRPLGEVILSEAEAAGVDLLVMGAYYHSPLREQIFGGVTRSMLAHARIPLFMFH